MAAPTITPYDHARYLCATGQLDLRTSLKIVLISTNTFNQSAATMTAALSGATELTTNGANRQALSSITVSEGSGKTVVTSLAPNWTAAGGSIPAMRGIIYKDNGTDGTSVPVASILLDGAGVAVTAADTQKLTVNPDPVNGWIDL